MPRRQGIHLTGADHEGGVGAQVRIHPPRQTHRRGGDRHRVLADPSLRPHALGPEKAAWNSLLSVGPVLPASCATRYASLSCPRICGSPSTMESSPEATLKACFTARCSWWTYRLEVRSRLLP